MAWPFPDFLRPIVRFWNYLTAREFPPDEIQARAEAHPHYWAERDVAAAGREAARSRYFLDFIRERLGTASFGSLWFAAARGAWYAAYGRAPTAEEREWAYTRPQGRIGLYAGVSGRGAWHGEERRITIRVNADWNSSWTDVEARVRDLVTSTLLSQLVIGSEPFLLESLEITPVWGALLQFHDDPGDPRNLVLEV